MKIRMIDHTKKPKTFWHDMRTIVLWYAFCYVIYLFMREFL